MAQRAINARSMILLAERKSGNTASSVCMRIGPFLSQSTFADASRMLDEMGLKFNKTAVSARKLKTWRVFIESPKTEESLKKITETLASLEIDHYPYEQNGMTYLSLGLFSQSGDARNFTRKLKDSGIEATYEPKLSTLGPLRWIEVDKVPDRYAREQLDAAEWGDTTAHVTRFPCQT